MLNILLAIIASYLIGSIPTSFLIGKARGIDVRKEGSGNVGATNVLRAVGKLPAVIALIIDIAKGVIAVILLVSFFFVPEGPITFNAFRALLGLSAVIGHNWSIFLKFKGGKGVATACGVLIILLPKAMAIAALVFLITIWLTKYVSLGSILLLLTVPIAAALLSSDVELVLLAITLCILISYKHKANIKRILAGTENKLGHK